MQGRGILMTLSYYRKWSWQHRGDVLAGIVVALALIPERSLSPHRRRRFPGLGLCSFLDCVRIRFRRRRPDEISQRKPPRPVLMITPRRSRLEYLLAPEVPGRMDPIGMRLS